jgi:hypothetical protein
MSYKKIEKTFVIGDIHAIFDEFKELLGLLDYKSERVKIICVGDFLDRGGDSIAVVRLAQELGLNACLGNHELKYLKWLRRSDEKKEETLIRQPHYAQFSEDDINWMSNLPLYIKIPEHDAVVIHAGMKPYLPIERQSREDLCYLRYTDKNGKFVSIRKIHEMGNAKAAGALFWTKRGPFNYKLAIYGHQVWDDVKIDRFDDGSECIGIDTGAAFGQKLTAICIETREIVSVKAKKIYYQPGFKILEE